MRDLLRRILGRTAEPVVEAVKQTVPAVASVAEDVAVAAAMAYLRQRIGGVESLAGRVALQAAAAALEAELAKIPRS